MQPAVVARKPQGRRRFSLKELVEREEPDGIVQLGRLQRAFLDDEAHPPEAEAVIGPEALDERNAAEPGAAEIGDPSAVPLLQPESVLLAIREDRALRASAGVSVPEVYPAGI